MPMYAPKTVLLLLLLCLSVPLQAQKFGFIDGNFILNKMPSFSKAKKDLDAFAQKSQKEVEEKFSLVKDLRMKYQAEEILLTPEMRRERLQEIEKKENEAKDFQQKVFGYEGLLYLKEKELRGPVLEELNKAVEKVARKNGLQVIYDKSSDFVIVYLDPRHDYTDYVLEELKLGDPEDNPKQNANKP